MFWPDAESTAFSGDQIFYSTLLYTWLLDGRQWQIRHRKLSGQRHMWPETMWHYCGTSPLLGLRCTLLVCCERTMDIAFLTLLSAALSACPRGRVLFPASWLNLALLLSLASCKRPQEQHAAP